MRIIIWLFSIVLDRYCCIMCLCWIFRLLFTILLLIKFFFVEARLFMRHWNFLSLNLDRIKRHRILLLPLSLKCWLIGCAAEARHYHNTFSGNRCLQCWRCVLLILVFRIITLVLLYTTFLDAAFISRWRDWAVTCSLALLYIEWFYHSIIGVQLCWLGLFIIWHRRVHVTYLLLYDKHTWMVLSWAILTCIEPLIHELSKVTSTFPAISAIIRLI